ncbi:glycosyltransferase family 9 protein [Maridesulfovibrio sp. FT414]|uniref:glycosyltransferase family 9 protein n=1 Tax=Maridesulfovibrio sp. FT414 TaxID=2979469 RepID=UPI003D801AB2
MNTNTHKVIFRLSALGDVVLTTGVLEYWAAEYGFTYTVITKSANVPVLENNPHIENVIGLEEKDLGDLTWLKKAGEISAQYEGCELIDLHSTLRSQILSARWKGKVSRYKKYSLERRAFKITRAPFLEKKLDNLSVTQRYAAALTDSPVPADVLLPRIYLSESELDFAQAIIDEHELGDSFIALHPYATHPDKAWPREHWLKLCGLLNRNKIRWAVIGRDKDIFESSGPECNFTNQLQLRETCAVLQKASRLVTGDSGPMHLAAAVGTPVTALFGPTSKAWGFYPAGPNDVVLESKMDCRPCSLHGKSSCRKDRQCLRDISPEQVLKHLIDQ